MSDTVILRVSSELKTKLKQRANKEGRTLEWMANDALINYLASTPVPISGNLAPAVKQHFDNKQNLPNHYKPTDDWGA